MAETLNSFTWYELLCDDVDDAIAFYGAVVGWEARDAGQPGADYRILSIAGTDIAGLMRRPAEVKAAWLGYVEVADADAAAADVTAAGGRVTFGPMDIPGVGRFAHIVDPQGASLDVLARSPAVAGSGAVTRGHCGWHELRTGDWQAAFDFYAGRFGWEKGEGFDMGPMGTYQLFAPKGGDPIGGMMNDPAGAPPAWRYYFVVDEIEAARSRVEAAGGRVLQPPVEVPGGAWVLVAADPQGVGFGLLAPAQG